MNNDRRGATATPLITVFIHEAVPARFYQSTNSDTCLLHVPKESRPQNSWSTRQSSCTHKETARFHCNCQPATWASICGMILARASSSIFVNEIYSWSVNQSQRCTLKGALHSQRCQQHDLPLRHPHHRRTVFPPFDWLQRPSSRDPPILLTSSTRRAF